MLIAYAEFGLSWQIAFQICDNDTYGICSDILSVLIWVVTVCKGYQQRQNSPLARKEITVERQCNAGELGCPATAFYLFSNRNFFIRSSVEVQIGIVSQRCFQ